MSEGYGRAMVRNALWILCNALYYGFARHLPYSGRPYAFGARRIRLAVCRHMLASCGRDVNIEHGAMFGNGRGISIGDNSGIGLDAFIAGPLTIGRNVSMGPRCMFLAYNHVLDRTDVPIAQQGIRPPRAPVVEDDVWLGAGVIVLPGRRIGTGSVVGAGSVVTKDIPPYSIAGGNPAVVIRQR
jgi:maltose O-acetyltransferase